MPKTHNASTGQPAQSAAIAASDSIAERIRAATRWREGMAPAHWPQPMRCQLARIGQAGTGLHAIVELLAMSDLERANKEDSDDGEGGDPLPAGIVSGLLDAALILCAQVEGDIELLGRDGAAYRAAQ